ncbi:hypothetical protein VTN02DRAFT_464 [Thermoascus thermophilus]
MFWGNRKQETDDGVARIRDEPRPDFSKEPLSREKLSPELQQLVDREDNVFDELYSPYHVESTDTPYRYAAYANRVRTLLLSAHRYVAYTSDIGESFRPVAHPWLVRSAYGISWAYVFGDVVHEGYKAYLRNRRVLAPPSEAYKDATDLKAPQVARGMATGNIGGSLTSGPGPSPGWSDGEGDADTLVPWPTAHIPLIEDYRMVMAKRAVFQSIASMGLPALTIHSVVKHSGRWLRNNKSAFIRTWAPIGLGLSVVPFLPYVFDEPVGKAVEISFRVACLAFGGEDAIRPTESLADSPSEDVATLSSVMKLHDQKRINEAEPRERLLGQDAAISWEAYKEEKRLAREQRRKERLDQREGKDASWFTQFGLGVSGKEKDE